MLNQRKTRVLIADDNTLARRIIRRTIERTIPDSAEREIVEVKEGSAVIEVMKKTFDAQEVPFDLLVVDQNMNPDDMTGVETARAVRAVLKQSTHLMKKLVIIGYSDDLVELNNKKRLEDFDAILGKNNFTTKRFVELLNEHLALDISRRDSFSLDDLQLDMGTPELVKRKPPRKRSSTLGTEIPKETLASEITTETLEDLQPDVAAPAVAPRRRSSQSSLESSEKKLQGFKV